MPNGGSPAPPAAGPTGPRGGIPRAARRPPARRRPPIAPDPIPFGAMFERTALPDGPRVISSRLPGSRSVTIEAHVLAGSRHEDVDQAGCAHFMEHLTFKGTRHYPTTRALSEAVEGIGGTFNASTDRETTVYYVRVPLRHAALAMTVLGELVARPLLDEK